MPKESATRGRKETYEESPMIHIQAVQPTDRDML